MLGVDIGGNGQRERSVNSLHQAGRLRMLSSSEYLLHAPFFHRVSHFFCRIGAPLIRHYSNWRAKPMNDVVFEKADESCCCGVRNCLELDVLAECVDGDDDVLVLFFR